MPRPDEQERKPQTPIVEGYAISGVESILHCEEELAKKINKQKEPLGKQSKI